MLQLIECLPSVRATGFLTTPLLDCHWLVIEASPKTNGCSKKSIHLQVAFLERTNVTNVCVWNEKKSGNLYDVKTWHVSLSNTDLIQGKRGTQQYFHRPHTRNSSGRRRAEHTDRGQPVACGPRWMFPRWFQVPWLVLDLREKLKSYKCLQSLWTISYRMHLGSCLIKYNIQYLRIKTYKVFFAVVNFDGLKTGLRWGSERPELRIVCFVVVPPPGGGWCRWWWW